MWGRGLATEAVGAVIERARRDLGLRELLAFVLPRRAASRRVLEKAGMVEAGVRPYRGEDNLLYVLRLDR